MGTFEVEINAFCIMTWLRACGGKGVVEYDTFNENDLQRLKYLDARFPVVGTV